MEGKVNKLELNELIEICKYIYKQLGPGFKAAVYSDILEVELELRNLFYTKQKLILKNNDTDCLVCYDRVLVAITCWENLPEEVEECFVDLLSDKKSQQALQINFGSQNLQFLRICDPVLGC